LLLTRRRTGIVVLAAAVACASAAVSRAGVFGALGLIAAIWLLSRRGAFCGLLIGCIIVVMGLNNALSVEPVADLGMAGSAFARHARPGTDTFEDRLWMMFGGLPQQWSETPLGTGLGAGQVGGVAAEEGHRALVAYEMELGRIQYEVGFLGLAAILFYRGSVLWNLWLAFTQSRLQPTSPLQQLRRCSILTLALFFMYNTCYDHVASSLTWIVAAVAFATLRLEPGSAVRTATLGRTGRQASGLCPAS
jgi:hypothetical protein